MFLIYYYYLIEIIAISVISAVGGLSVYSSTLTPAVLPIALVVLVLLFLIQKFGTSK